MSGFSRTVARACDVVRLKADTTGQIVGVRDAGD
jgi:hypothetical protein